MARSIESESHVAVADAVGEQGGDRAGGILAELCRLGDAALAEQLAHLLAQALVVGAGGG